MSSTNQDYSRETPGITLNKVTRITGKVGVSRTTETKRLIWKQCSWGKNAAREVFVRQPLATKGGVGRHVNCEILSALPRRKWQGNSLVMNDSCWILDKALSCGLSCGEGRFSVSEEQSHVSTMYLLVPILVKFIILIILLIIIMFHSHYYFYYYVSLRFRTSF